MAEIGCNWARIGPSKSSQSLSIAHKWAVQAVITKLQATDRRRQAAITELLAADRRRQAQFIKALKLMKRLQTQMIEFESQQGPAKGLAQPDALEEAGSSS
ncbi:hypothetical protein Tco_1477390 [Tanacetum coccineum]